MVFESYLRLTEAGPPNTRQARSVYIRRNWFCDDLIGTHYMLLRASRQHDVMAAARMDALDNVFDDHPSFSASLEDFEHSDPHNENNRSPLFVIPSHHSGFYKSDDGDSDLPESDSGGPWSPPAWRRDPPVGSGAANNGMWQLYKPSPHRAKESSAHGNGSPLKRSRETSPLYESANEGDTTLPPQQELLSECHSPQKREGSGFQRESGGQAQDGPLNQRAGGQAADNPSNYIRFAMRAEVQHRTEPFEAAFSYFREKFDIITSSRASIIMSFGMVLFATILLRLLFQPPPPPPVPDLVKVAGLAKSFEPLIFYSENGAQQIGELQETGVAVWDLGESVRSTNMTSAPIIVKELDDLSESLKTLAMELTKFFANVDGDVDGILIVMEWAKRELSQLSSLPLSSLTSVFDNLHSVFCRVGIFESPNGNPTSFGKFITDLFGQSRPQRTRNTLQRTFNEFLGVLEESINNELTYSAQLFALFESIDRQFLNLARTVIRESDQQEREEGELLSSLWTRVLGPNAAKLRKYEKNRLLLSNVRERTVRNKHLLVDHNGKLLTLKANLEMLRKKLVSPLVRSNDSSTLSVEEQIRGLDVTYEHLKTVRERQKGMLMELLYGAGSRRFSLGGGVEGHRIEGSRSNEHERYSKSGVPLHKQNDPDQDELPHATEEAAELGKIMGESGLEIEHGTPVQEILRRDQEGLQKAPQVIREELNRTAGENGRLPFSTLEELGETEVTALGHKHPLPELPLAGNSNLKHRYDPIVQLVTNLMMKDGKLSVAQRNMSLILQHLRTSPPPSINPDRPLLPSAPPPSHLPLNPTLYLMLAIDSVAPLLRIRAQKGAAGGGAALQIPVPLGLRQRRRRAIEWVLDAASKRRSRGSGKGGFAQRVAEEIVSVVEGKSTVWDKRGAVHKLGVSARANLSISRRR
ncbi:hypothetical protein FGG08_001511 [Glutinoglossum americanum]|uniref:Small ribosomal subunit protein uS7m n=1 Tax=Glutinoglossum americanum TaxID=1670608 RepID=A0A9P8IB75_9PEZI|nr:hypothetical protein FGG08_001511 [Glutinoglossum americanum]